MFNKFLLTALSFTLISTASSISKAQTELPQPMGFAGLLLGYADPADLDGRLGYGAEIGLAFPAGFTGFGYFMGSEADDNGVKSSLAHYGVGGEYNFTNFLPGLRAGLRLGMATGDVTVAGVKSSDSVFSVGPHIGWDYRIAPNFSVGVEPIIMIDMGDDTETSLYVFGTGRFWF